MSYISRSRASVKAIEALTEFNLDRAWSGWRDEERGRNTSEEPNRTIEIIVARVFGGVNRQNFSLTCRDDPAQFLEEVFVVNRFGQIGIAARI